MNKNVGTLDAIMRITCGFTGLAWGTSKMNRHSDRTLPVLVSFYSAMKVAEGITRYCPMLDMLNMNSEKLLTQEDASDNEQNPHPSP
ncbi:YgaP family membrane protein [Natribacillus halophilus]|uniref:Inner membrane protein YgaP-like transmembrane domain-containing protein n=1 Tax=Natribacillus halophilus TaxID=549003 RepID=A0A1G8NEB7_9BACI|nr:DUF2892 domain-containing protein [Natribacillus halophilus]SDI78407.1 Protein of unknown function [Natribacillus halophilus]